METRILNKDQLNKIETTSETDIGLLRSTQFTDVFALKSGQFAWLLGAGASASAGIPTAYDMIMDFKKRLFCQLSGTSRRLVDTNDPIWAERIIVYLSKHSDLPDAGDHAEYAATFEAVYPDPKDRRAYIDNAVKKGTPSFAHRALASLITSKMIPCIFTTNFDSMIETATVATDQLVANDDRAYLTVSAIDNVERACLCMRENRWPLLAKIHGDYQSIALKNTPSELKEQDAQMRTLLTEACHRFGLVIVGYSGRDHSVMNTLNEVLDGDNPFPGGIYWITKSHGSILPAVKDFLNRAANRGVRTATVESKTFDELAADLIDGTSIHDALLNHVMNSRSEPFLQMVSVPTQEARDFPVLRCSALPIMAMPTKARRVQLRKIVDTKTARNILRDKQIRAAVASNGKEISAFGKDSELLTAYSSLGAQIDGTIDLRPTQNSWALGLMYDALTRAVCKDRPLVPIMRQNGHIVVVKRVPIDVETSNSQFQSTELRNLKNAYPDSLHGHVRNRPGITFSEGVKVKLENIDDQWWLVYEPTTHVKDQELDEVKRKANLDMILDWRRERWAKRYNPIWAKIIASWADMLANSSNGSTTAYGIPASEGIDAVFEISGATAWARPAHMHSYFLKA